MIWIFIIGLGFAVLLYGIEMLGGLLTAALAFLKSAIIGATKE